MADLEEGMTNFRDFTRTMRDFVSRSDERAIHRAQKEEEEKEEADKRDARRARMHYWWLGLLSAAIITLLSYVLNWTHDFEKRHHVSESTTIQSQPTHAKDE